MTGFYQLIFSFVFDISCYYVCKGARKERKKTRERKEKTMRLSDIRIPIDKIGKFSSCVRPLLVKMYRKTNKK